MSITDMILGAIIWRQYYASRWRCHAIYSHYFRHSIYAGIRVGFDASDANIPTSFSLAATAEEMSQDGRRGGLALHAPSRLLHACSCAFSAAAFRHTLTPLPSLLKVAAFLPSYADISIITARFATPIRRRHFQDAVAFCRPPPAHNTDYRSLSRYSAANIGCCRTLTRPAKDERRQPVGRSL